MNGGVPLICHSVGLLSNITGSRNSNVMASLPYILLILPLLFSILYAMFLADRIVHKSVAFYLAKEETSCKNPSAHEQLKCVTTMFE